MTWYSVEVPEASMQDGTYYRLCRQFQRAFITAGAPAEMALFAGSSAAGRARTLFLSPGSVEHVSEMVAEQGAKPCDGPHTGNVILVYGVPGAEHDLLAPAVKHLELPVEKQSRPRLVRRQVAMAANAA